MTLNLNETTLDLFEQYARNQLNEQDLAAFKLKLNQDHEFNVSYQTFLTSKAIINEKIEDSLREKMKEWNANSITHEKIEPEKIIQLPAKEINVRRMNWSRWTAAASVLLIFTVGYNYKVNHGDLDNTINEQLAFNPVSTRSSGLVPPNTVDLDKIISDLEVSHDQIALEKAVIELIQIKPTDPNQNLGYRLLGNVYTRLGKEELAVEALKKSNAERDLIELSKIFCQLKNKKHDPELQQKLDIMLENTNGAYHEIFQSLKKKTNSFMWRLFN